MGNCWDQSALAISYCASSGCSQDLPQPMVVHPLNRQVSVYNAQIEHVCTGFAVCQCCTVVISLSFPHSLTHSLTLPPSPPTYLSHTLRLNTMLNVLELGVACFEYRVSLSSLL